MKSFQYVLDIGLIDGTHPVTPWSKNPPEDQPCTQVLYSALAKRRVKSLGTRLPVDLARCKWEKSFPSAKKTAKKRLERTLGKSTLKAVFVYIAQSTLA